MARIRTVKPEFWTSEQVMDVSPLARLAFIGMWNFCDDAGIHSANTKRLKAELFPSDDISQSDLRALVDELIEAGLLIEYEVDGESYWQVTGWHHQKIDQPTYKHPRPDGSIPAGAPKRRATKAAAPAHGERSPDLQVEQGEQSASAGDGNGERSDDVRKVFAEHSQNVPGLFDGCSPPEGKVMEGSKPSVPNGTDAVASPGKQSEDSKTAQTAEQMPTTKEQIWHAGKSLLMVGGADKAQAGAFIGKLCKDYTEAVVLEAVQIGVTEQPADARAFLRATCQRIAGERTAAPPAAQKSRFDLSGMDYTARPDGLPF
jgi:hypothetical protein